MKFVVFSLDDFHVHRKEGTKVGVKFIDARSLGAAKQFIKRHYPGAWAIVSKRTFDQGIVRMEGGDESYRAN